jgi:hypothetical protein
MSDFDSYLSLVKRQQKKLDYALTLIPVFASSVPDIGPNPSANELARWLNTQSVKPSPNTKGEARWVPQSVLDMLYFDGIEPTPESLGEFAPRDQKERKRLLRQYGFRFTASLEWIISSANLQRDKGEAHWLFQRQKHEQHIDRIREVAKLVRGALLIPERA